MATFRKRGDKWSYRIDIGKDPITNERRQVTISGFKTKRDAINAAATRQHEIDNGTHIMEQDILFPDFVKLWIKGYENSVKISTVRIRKHESRHLNSYFEFTKLKNITKKMYQEALNDLKKRGLSDNTISGVHTTGKMLFSKAVEFDMIKINPTQYAKIPRTQRTVEQIENNDEVPKYLEKEELAIFLKVAKERGLNGDYAIFTVLAYSGIRAGELSALKWTDFDFEEHTVSITKTYYNPDNNTLKYVLLTPKTKTSIRKIELAPSVFDELKKLQILQKEVRMMHRTTYHDKGFVFASTDQYPGYPINIKKVEKRFARLLKLSKLNESLTPHSLRHTHTSLLAEAGVGLQEIMERLGHKNDETTKSVYLHVTKTMKKEASQKFDQLMKNL